jgi:hypothetical protein
MCLGEGVASRDGQPVGTATRRSPGGGDCGHRAGDVRDSRRLWRGRHGRRVAAGNGHSKSSIVRFSRPTRGSSRNEPTFEGRAFVEAGARIAAMTQHAQRPSVPHLASSCVARRLGGLLGCRPPPPKRAPTSRSRQADANPADQFPLGVFSIGEGAHDSQRTAVHDIAGGDVGAAICRRGREAHRGPPRPGSVDETLNGDRPTLFVAAEVCAVFELRPEDAGTERESCAPEADAKVASKTESMVDATRCEDPQTSGPCKAARTLKLDWRPAWGECLRPDR